MCTSAVCAAQADTTPDLPESNIQSAGFPDHVLDMSDRVSRSTNTYFLPKLSEHPQYSPYGLACDIKFTATPTAAAMVVLNLNAPCQINAPIEISHHGLEYSAVTSNIGHYTATVPASAPNAVYDLTLAGDEQLSAKVNMPEAVDFYRAAIQWSGTAGFEIHAFEMGAAAGRNGHVWVGAPKTAAHALQARGGFMTRFGMAKTADSKHVEFYSFPTNMLNKSGIVRLHIMVKVTKETCGQELAAKIMQMGNVDQERMTDITISMPDCGRIGEVLQLKTLLRDLKTVSKQE